MTSSTWCSSTNRFQLHRRLEPVHENCGAHQFGLEGCPPQLSYHPQLVLHRTTAYTATANVPTPAGTHNPAQSQLPPRNSASGIVAPAPTPSYARCQHIVRPFNSNLKLKDPSEPSTREPLHAAPSASVSLSCWPASPTSLRWLNAGSAVSSSHLLRSAALPHNLRCSLTHLLCQL